MDARQHRHRCAAALGLLALLPAAGTHAHEDHVGPIEELVVYGRAEEMVGVARSASEGMVGYDDLRLPPLLRAGELAEVVPGMVATQHSGTGKANQYFLRGFNLDHGTDFSARAEGVPLNMRSHGHGQGYLDLNFLIPELVATSRYQKGPYDVAAGDFSSAGNVRFQFFERLEDPVLEVGLGQDGWRRGLAAGSTSLAEGALTVALDLARYDGPWQREENLEQERVYLAWAGPVLDGLRGKLTVQGYHSEWDATDQIPERAVADGRVDRLGALDPDLGGDTSRWSLSAAVDAASWRAGLYSVAYDFTLFSNFTYLLDDPVNGDEFEQRDVRRTHGAWVEGSRDLTAGDAPLRLRWGSELRLDDVDKVGLYRTRSRERLATVRQDDLWVGAASAWLDLEWQPLDKLRLAAGLRGDHLRWDVDARQAANSGDGNDHQWSPTLGAAWRVAKGLEAYANYGRGLHSNDVRGTTIRVDPASGDPVDRVPALVASDGAELGLRWERGPRFNATVTAFWLQLESELVFVGDAGGTEANPGSRRHGVETNLFWQATNWLALNAAWTGTRARYRGVPGNEEHIPGAIESTFALGATMAWRSGWSASLRLRHLGEAPLNEDDSVRADSSTLVNAGVAWRRGPLEVEVELFNVLDSDDNDISYLYASRLAGEPADGVEDVHFHPLEPRTARLGVRWYL